MDDFSISLNVEWKTFDTFFALDSFERYLKENERLILDAANIEELTHRPDWKPVTQEEYAEYSAEVRGVRHLHEEIMTPVFRYSCVVILYAILEREIRRFIETLAKERKLKKVSYKEFRGSLFEQVNRFGSAFCDLTITDIPEYPALIDFQKVRDCIVHCYGDISMSKDKRELQRIGKAKLGLVCDSEAQFEIERIYIESSLICIQKFFLHLFQRVNWKIDESWQTK